MNWSTDPPFLSGLYKIRTINSLLYSYVFVFYKQSGVYVYSSSLGELSIEDFYNNHSDKLEWLKIFKE